MDQERYSDEAYRLLGLKPPLSRTAIPEGPQDVASILDASVETFPNHEAVVGPFSRLSYSELAKSVRAAVSLFVDLGIKPGDRLAASLGNHTEVVICFLASQRIGAIWLGINVAYAAAEKAHMLKDAEVKLLIAQPSVLEELEEVLSELPDLQHIISCDPEKGGTQLADLLHQHQTDSDLRNKIDPWAPAAIGYTSGTTGFPKGAVHSQHNMALVAATRRNLPTFSIRHGIATPLTILNLMILGPVAAFARGSTIICLPKLYAPDIANWVGREKIGSLNSAPAVLYDMLTKPEINRDDLKSLAAPGLGSAHVSDQMRKLFTEFFGGMTYAYGLTEAPTAVASTEIGETVPSGSVGFPFSHVEISIRGKNDEILPPNDVGEICITPSRDGPWANVYTPMLGYWKLPAETENALRGGALHTGDLGCKDADGRLYIKGRLKDVIIRGGANVYPAEVERIIQEDPDIISCAVTGKPDERLGETVAAFIQLRPGSRPTDQVEQELKDRCLAELSKFKCPVDWIFVDEMPRNQMNKIVKKSLRDQYFA